MRRQKRTPLLRAGGIFLSKYYFFLLQPQRFHGFL
nr:MAG TPA: hypothetical protein [Caudoviricetes sp.]